MIDYSRLMRSGLTASLALLMVACGSAEDDPGDPDNQNQNDDPVEVEAPGEEITSEVSRQLEPDVDEEVFEEFTEDNRDFAFSLIDQIRADQEGENAFVSPHSISVALAMMHAGAAEQTRSQMAEALRFELDDEQLHPAFNKLDLALDERSEVELDDDESLDLDIVNQTWGQEDFDFVDEYLDVLAEHYGASQKVVDFITNYEQIRQQINEWVEAKTEERIQDLLPDNSLEEDTRFVLVNAIYFYGTWDEPFVEDQTFDRDFTRLDDSTVEVPMMSEDATFEAYRDPEADTMGLSIPYSGEEVSMVAMMPTDADHFQQWEQDFDRQVFDEVVEGLQSQRVQMSFPRFEDDAEFELSEILAEMGMVDAFDECDADFEGITGHPPCQDFKSLYIDEVYHQTFISVDEEGTEAAGATGVVADTPTSAPPQMHFDRPFYYAIYDHPTDTILFLGRMVDPS